MFDFYYLTPIPVINFTIGLGVGTANLSCELATSESCSDLYESGSIGSAYQWYGQLGYSFLPFFDVHLTYQNLTAKVKHKDGGSTDSFNGSVIGAGVAFIF